MVFYVKLIQTHVKIDKYLVDGEHIAKTFALSGYDVHATTKRLFISSFNGNDVQDYDYGHISSLLFHVMRYYWLIVLGAALLVVSWVLRDVRDIIPSSENFLMWFLIAIGIACIIVGILKKKEYMKIYVIGVPPPVLEGKRANLEELFKTIRQKKEEATVSAGQLSK